MAAGDDVEKLRDTLQKHPLDDVDRTVTHKLGLQRRGRVETYGGFVRTALVELHDQLVSAHSSFAELRFQHLPLGARSSPALQSDDRVRSTSSFSLQRTPYDSCTPTLRTTGVTVSTRSSFPATEASSVSAVFFPTTFARVF